MKNLFCTHYATHRRFDLKGSSHGRTTCKPESEVDPTTTLKDLDLNYIFRLQKLWFQEFCRQVERDCDFLEQERIMDYSLLIGFHFREVSSPSATEVVTSTGNQDPENEGTPQQSEALVGEPTGVFCDVILFFGIINILQDNDITKVQEARACKLMQYVPTSISAVDPKQTLP
ncbi:hypothetical protein V6N12_070094 [Hibiscus sabdariffa]|uniref:1-phosphatidylinositol-4-phosphate 5-kinase n=1 Tax=Hibiscus sabdariffa TaxID=183260 RepID=A0ABR2FFW1_9ROSI